MYQKSIKVCKQAAHHEDFLLSLYSIWMSCLNQPGQASQGHCFGRDIGVTCLQQQISNSPGRGRGLAAAVAAAAGAPASIFCTHSWSSRGVNGRRLRGRVRTIPWTWRGRQPGVGGWIVSFGLSLLRSCVSGGRKAVWTVRPVRSDDGSHAGRQLPDDLLRVLLGQCLQRREQLQHAGIVRRTNLEERTEGMCLTLNCI